MPLTPRILLAPLAIALSLLSARVGKAADSPTFEQVHGTLNTYCKACHSGKTALGGFNLSKYPDSASVTKDLKTWQTVLDMIREQAMPPKGTPAPEMKEREQVVDWLHGQLRLAACSDGITPGPSLVRRLNRSEYSATVRDLLSIQINAAHALPADGAGGEGFDNAAETLFLSPVHAEKYLEAAKQALDYGSRDPRSRSVFIVAEPNEFTTPEQAARRVLEWNVPRAFRRPAREGEIEKYLALFQAAQKSGDSYDDSILYALQGLLLSPNFLFRVEAPNPTTEPRLLDDYVLASRLSYFLWGSMPDEELMRLAANGELQKPEVLDQQVVRMLKDLRVREFAENFVEQWLGTRELGRDIRPDPELFAEYYDDEIKAAIRYEPILFFEEILTENLSLLNLIDSHFTYVTNKLFKHYDLKVEVRDRLRQQPRHVDLPPGSDRGGLLGMAAVLAVSSYPNRTSPVLRGKWVLDALLGTPPPPPPPNVPELEEEHAGVAPKTLRERLEKHRENPVCASCHSRIDPIGFGLENYDVLGRWRSEEAGKPVDAKGELPDGSTFSGPVELKKVLMERKDLLLRNLTAKLLGYALGRGLTMEDYCTVDKIVEELGPNGYRAHTLVQGIVRSIPFRYQAGNDSDAPAPAALISKRETP